MRSTDRSVRAVGAVVVAACLIAACGPATRSAAADSEIDYLLEALDRWHHGPDVYCTFSEHPGTVAEAGDDGYDGLKIKESTASGLWVKLGDEVRYEKTYVKARVIVQENLPGVGPAVLARNTNIVALCGPDLVFDYHPHSRYATLARRGDRRFTSVMDMRGIAPTALNPYGDSGGLGRAVIRRMEEAAAPGANPLTVEVLHPSVDRTEIQIEERILLAGQQHVSVQRIVLATDVAQPYPVQLGWMSTVDGEPRSRSWKYLDDFVVLQGWHVPRRMVTVIFDKLNQRRPYACSVWQSDDLGDRPPTGGDLVVEIPANSWYRGFKRPMNYEEPQTIRLANYTLDDTYAPDEKRGQMQGPDPREVFGVKRRTARLSPWSTTAAVAAALGASLLVIIWRRRRMHVAA